MSIHMNNNLAEHRILGSPPSSAKPLEMAVLCWSEICGERMFLLCRYLALLLRCWQDFLHPVNYILLFYPLQHPAALGHRNLWGGETPCRGWGRCWPKLCVFWKHSPQECCGNRLSIVISQTIPNNNIKYNFITLISPPQTKLYYI